jgi:hypothetical protein
MRLIKIGSFLLILSLFFGGCKKIMEPESDYHSTVDRIYNDPSFAEGLLLTAYIRLPTNSLSLSEAATDNAVSNSKTDPYHRMATGEWSSLYNPLDQWSNSNSAILYINNFLSIIDTVAWKWSSNSLNKMYARRFKGEAYALRALFEYHLLVTVGGTGNNGDLLGIPLFNKIGALDDFNTTRASFVESVKQIYADYDKALEFLNMGSYKDISSASQLPPGFDGIDVTDYNSVFGSRTSQRISGQVVKALKARVALLAASPAFSAGDVTLWEKAANFAAAAVIEIGGLPGLDPNGTKFYDATRVDAINLASNIDQKEIVWRRAITTGNNRELANFPPSLFGQGNINPTQNLVDAFPMLNGYPITDPAGKYDPANPYASRDPRLALYIAYNGVTMKSQVIKTGVGGGINAKDSVQTSTRTGYYLRKMLREDVNLDPVSTTTKKNYETYMRYTEVFLIYAEAANEAWGPDATGPNAFSARTVMAAIRKRAGIAQPDNYLSSLSKDDMKKLIRNERRLELCFEGFRFWDLRRWNIDLTETARGVNINNSVIKVVDVEPRQYTNDYMHYGPIPQNEVVKFSTIIQNKGWK